MAAYNPSLSNHRNVLPTPYLSYQKLDDMRYMLDSVTGDDQMLSRTPVNFLGAEQNLQYQGLSLSLGTQIPSSMPSLEYQYMSPGPYVQDSGENDSQSEVLRNADYSSSNFANNMYDMIKIGALNDPNRSIIHNGIYSGPHVHEASGLGCTIYNSKYVKAVQQLLDEVVNVYKSLKRPELSKHHFHKPGSDCSEETHSVLPSMNGMASNTNESTTDSSYELSTAEREELQRKRTKLLSMLDEVDKRYRQYYHQMQIVVSSFEMVAGHGAAKPYTALALQTISRHFRCLRDAINGQIQPIQQGLGEQDIRPHSQGRLPRLRYLDQRIRQQKSHQMMPHSWRPQRGLPESSVTILRAWLFEHFLNPYPKDSEKIMLARQTGLTRSQVANWFINARVRLWKPMVEEIYKEEFGDPEADSKSSPEHAPKAAGYKSASEDRGEELQQNLAYTGANGVHLGQFNDSKPDLIPEVEMNGFTARLGFQNGARGDDNVDRGGMNSQRSRRHNVNEHSFSPNEINQTSEGSLMDNVASYDISVLNGYEVGNQVSLALKLQHSENDPLPTPAGMHFRGDDTRASPVELDEEEHYYMDPVNRQHRFATPTSYPIMWHDS